VPLNGVGWTLNYEMYFYAIFALAIALPRRLAVAAISLLFAAIVLAGLLFAPLPNPLAFWADTIILEFVFGMGIALALREGVRLPRWLGWGCVIAGLAAYVWVGRYGLGDMPRVVYWGLPSALIIAGLAGMARPAEDRPPNAVTRFFAFLGDASYSIYLVHPFMLTAPRLVMFGLSGDDVSPPAQPWLYAALQFAAAVIAGVALHLLFERPVTRWLRARSEGRATV
jgi:exopolysaccharide production protein ExoZ